MIRFIRKNKRFTTFFIFITLGAFAIVPLFRAWEVHRIEEPIFARIDGKDVDRQAYKERYDYEVLRAIYLENKEPAYAAYHAHIRTWNFFKQKMSIEGVLENIGIMVLGDENTELFLTDKQLREQMRDPKTGKVNEDELIRKLKKRASTEEGKRVLIQEEERSAYHRSLTKYKELIVRGYSKTAADQAFQEAIHRKKVYVDILFVPSEAVLEETSTPAEEEAYFKAHQQNYQWEDEKEVVYIMHKVESSDRDWEVLNQKIEEAAKRLASKKGDPKSIARRYSDNKEDCVVEWYEEDIPAIIKHQLAHDKRGNLAVSNQVVIIENEKKDTHTLYRLIEIKRNVLLERKYVFAKIEKQLKISEDTREDCERDAAKFATIIKEKKITTAEAFKEEAKEYGYRPDEVKLTKKQAQQVGAPPSYLINHVARWAYKSGKLKQVSEPILVNNQYYIVLMILNEHKKGPKKFQEAAKEVNKEVVSENRKEQIRLYLTPLLTQKNNIQKARKHYQNNSYILRNKEITMQTSSLHEKMGDASFAIGRMLALSAGESCICVTKNGVMITRCRRVEETPEQTEEEKRKSEKNEKEIFFSILAISYINLLEDGEKIQDERYKFFE